MTASSLPSFTFRNVLISSALLRVGLILYSEWHDARSLVKYTDVDYRVFTDAAAFISTPGAGDENQAAGPLQGFFGFKFGFGSPYTRETYRYTPLLALLLTPNAWLHPSFGKYVFAACDLLNGWLIYRMLLTEIIPEAEQSPGESSSSGSGAGKRRKLNPYLEERRERMATIYSAVHLLNPLVFSISTRGSSESVLSLFVLATLYAAMNENWDWAGVLLGLSTHWKIYPVVYGVSLLGVITATSYSSTERAKMGRIATLVNPKTIRFGIVSASTFVLLGASCYAIWGYPFLYESYLYHVHRLDHRHNFSPYFYLTYLIYPSSSPSTAEVVPLTWWNELIRSPLTSFVPQMGLALGTGLAFGRTKRDLVFAWFVQTVVFVVFNKVCTSQYFLWYLLLLPLLLPELSMSWRRAFSCIVVWAATQGLWLSEAYKLEFLGENVYFSLWVRGLIYVMGNCWVLVQIMKAYRATR
ncbi:GPI mannosyltransferase 1 [Ephemerocybe angulata]|uniref:GPI mannosyltransferase 1 n=1 Tax=Ephemerocybe angulata TaxID=980116 RepID=A0A8H6MC64_9AGAR|nr:GPI mannosyltransferase 1 [Tulosesus angulatus]